MKTYYNDADAACCSWLKALMGEKLIAEGTVDGRDIRQVGAADLVGYERVALFAGIAGWERALQLAKWPLSQPVWTVSCPCPPFSTAGKKKACPACGGRAIPCPRRTGHFICLECEHAWLADERHLWPEAWRLIRDLRPPVVLGEQVAGHDGLIWLAGVRATLEKLGYSFGAADLCAAGVSAPHIRQRLFWVALAGEGRHGQRGDKEGRVGEPERGGGGGHPANTEPRGVRLRGPGEAGGTPSGVQGSNGKRQRVRPVLESGGDLFGGLANTARGERGQRKRRDLGAQEDSSQRQMRLFNTGGCGVDDWLGDTGPEGLQERQGAEDGFGAVWDEGPASGEAGPSDWNDSILVRCRDIDTRTGQNRYRRVPQSVLLGLVDGLPAGVGGFGPARHGFPLTQEKIEGRVGVLRGLGNAIVPQVAAVFIRAVMEVLGIDS